MMNKIINRKMKLLGRIHLIQSKFNLFVCQKRGDLRIINVDIILY